MTRARVLGALLGVVLLACAVVIYLDQRGSFGGTAANTGTSTGVSTPDPSTSTSDGYGDLK